MQECTLIYIPARLHSIGKNIIEEFYVGEELYYRCNSGECEKPYNNISLYDISHNRNFLDPQNFPKQDVLYDINPETETEVIPNKQINTSTIKSVNGQKTFYKLFESESKDLFAKIKLVHNPVACMYSHCVFQISVNDVIVTKDNYKDVLDKKNAAFKNLRRDIRLELTSIIYSSIVDNDEDVEIISEL